MNEINNITDLDGNFTDDEGGELNPQKDREFLNFAYDYNKYKRTYRSSEAFNSDMKLTWQTYRRHINTVRMNHKNDFIKLKQMGLNSPIHTYAGAWLYKAQTFYINIITDLAKASIPPSNWPSHMLGLPLKEIKKNFSILVSLEHSEYYLDKQVDEETEMADMLDHAFENVKHSLDDIQGPIKDAFKDDPQTMEMLGMDDEEDDDDFDTD